MKTLQIKDNKLVEVPKKVNQSIKDMVEIIEFYERDRNSELWYVSNKLKDIKR